MRSEKEMLELIVNTAREDEWIRAAYLEGSRVNPEIPSDIFQDYDVVYVVKETGSFQADKEWISRFGEILYMQYPEESVYYCTDVKNCYGWLMQFADGNRLDLHVCTLQHVRNNLELYRILMDKDNCLPRLEVTANELYGVHRPSQAEFSCTCNEFWWCLNNIAKGLWRKEILYVMDVINHPVRPMLRRLLEWKTGMNCDFSISLGKSAKYMNQYVEAEIYQKYLQTYCAADVDEAWKAVFLMCDLFQETAMELSGRLNLSYDLTEARMSREYLEHVKRMPADAKEIY